MQPKVHLLLVVSPASLVLRLPIMQASVAEALMPSSPANLLLSAWAMPLLLL
jgi:hypothetical protein